jgi:hypothetical protein
MNDSCAIALNQISKKIEIDTIEVQHAEILLLIKHYKNIKNRHLRRRTLRMISALSDLEASPSMVWQNAELLTPQYTGTQ